MYAVIKTGGKQYRVEQDDVIDVELLKCDKGSVVEFNDVLFIQNGSESLIGEPSVRGFVVKGEVIGETVGPKIVSLKYTPRQHTQTGWGHRQHYTRVKITEIGSGTGEAPKKKVVAKEVANKTEGTSVVEENTVKAAPKKAVAKPKSEAEAKSEDASKKAAPKAKAPAKAKKEEGK